MRYLSELYADNSEESFGKPVEVLRVGHWDLYGEGLDITEEMLQNMVKNFKEGLHPEPPTKLVIDYNHGSSETNPELSKAAGWIEDMFTENSRLFIVPSWTEQAKEYIQNGEFGYVSAEFAKEYPSKKDGSNLGATLAAVAITNRPYIEGQEKLALSDNVRRDLQKKAKARSSKYHIHVRSDGHLSIPKQYSDCPEGEFADPVNYMYPCNSEERAVAAYKYFSKPKNQSFYNKSEIAMIKNRIKKHLPARMKKTAFNKGGNMEEDVQKIVQLNETIKEKEKLVAEKDTLLKQKEDEILKLKDENKKLSESLLLTEANEWVNETFTEHKMFPKEKESMTKLYLSNKELAKELVEKRGVVVKVGVEGSSEKTTPDKKLSEIVKIRKYAEEHKITFAEARLKMAKLQTEEEK